MIQFEKEGVVEYFTVKVEGGQSEYIATIKAMLFFMSQHDSDVGDIKHEIYYMCRMIDAMLPKEGQIIDVDKIAQYKHDNEG